MTEISDWTWLSYLAFGMYLRKGCWILRNSTTPKAWPCRSRSWDEMLPLMHEEAERLLGEDYLARDVDGVAVGVLSLNGEANLRYALASAHAITAQEEAEDVRRDPPGAPVQASSVVA